MGYLQTLAAGSDHITPAAPRSGLDRASAASLLSIGEIAGNQDAATAYVAADEISTVDQLTGTPSGGTYTVTVNFTALGISYTTAVIAYTAAAATIETALDTASPATIADGDVAVTDSGSAGLSDGTATFTCSTTAGSTPCLISVDNTSVTGIGAAQTTTRGTPGQSERRAAQSLFDMNIVSGSLHNSGEVPTWTKPDVSGRARPGTGVIWDLALQTITEDGTEDAYDAIVALYPQVAKM